MSFKRFTKSQSLGEHTLCSETLFLGDVKAKAALLIAG